MPHDGRTERDAAAEAIDRACRETGFILVAGHGIAHETRSAMFEQMARFFNEKKVPARAVHAKTPEAARHEALQGLRDGTVNAVFAVDLFNEGVDVPAANVGLILSGTGSVREHVQRLGRLLRKHGEKQAILYEVVTRDTGEEYTSERRRQHQAYR